MNKTNKNKARKNKDGRSKSKTSQWQQIETNIKLNKDTGKYQVTLYDGERRGYKNVETLQEAREVLIEYGAKRIRGGGYKLTPETFTEYAENFLGICTLKASTKDGYKAILNRIRRAPIGRLKIRDIIPRDIEVYKKSLMDEGHLGRNTINKHINFISTVFEDTVKNGIKDINPARTIARLTRNSYHGQALTVEQVNDLIETLETENGGIDTLTLQAAVYLGLFAGLRRGEVFGLKWESINFPESLIKIENTRVFVRDKGLIDDTPKSQEGFREVGANPFLLDTLKRLRETQAAICKKPCEYVLSTGKGEPYKSCSNIERRFKAILQKAELPNIRFHDLRDTYGTLACEAGVNLTIIASQLGHSSIAITGKYYVQQRKENAQKAANAIFEVIKQEHLDRRAAAQNAK